jgi:cell division protein FtsQ
VARKAPPRSVPPRRKALRSTPVHPKFRARRVSVARTAGRRRLRRLVLAVGLVALVFAAGGIVLSPLLDVDRIVIAGAGPRLDEVRAAAEVERGTAILLLDTGAASERIESLAWVAHADVVREVPGTVKIQVTARPPVAFVPRSDGTYGVVDATGTVVSVEAAPPPGLTSLVSDAPDVEPGDRIRPRAAAVVAAALGPLADRVTRVFVDQTFEDQDRAALLLADGSEVRLGRLDRLAEKARAADAVLRSLDGTPVTYLDVRVPSAPVTG